MRDLTVLLRNVNTPPGRPSARPAARFPRPVTAIELAKQRAEAAIEAELDDLIAAAHASFADEHREEG